MRPAAPVSHRFCISLHLSLIALVSLVWHRPYLSSHQSFNSMQLSLIALVSHCTCLSWHSSVIPPVSCHTCFSLQQSFNAVVSHPTCLSWQSCITAPLSQRTSHLIASLIAPVSHPPVSHRNIQRSWSSSNLSLIAPVSHFSCLSSHHHQSFNAPVFHRTYLSSQSCLIALFPHCTCLSSHQSVHIAPVLHRTCLSSHRSINAVVSHRTCLSRQPCLIAPVRQSVSVLSPFLADDCLCVSSLLGSPWAQ